VHPNATVVPHLDRGQPHIAEELLRYRSPMADNSSSSGMGDILGFFGNANPISGITKSIGQMQTGVGQLFDSIERFNSMIEQVGAAMVRVNGLLDAVDEPTLKSALEQAWRLKAGKRLLAELDART